MIIVIFPPGFGSDGDDCISTLCTETLDWKDPAQIIKRLERAFSSGSDCAPLSSMDSLAESIATTVKVNCLSVLFSAEEEENYCSHLMDKVVRTHYALLV